MVNSPEEFWGSNPYKNPPLTNAAIELAETRLGVRLPEEYLALLRHQNGGLTREFAHPMSQRTSWSEDHVPVDELAGIVTDPNHEGMHNILLSEEMTAEWGLPPRQVLLAGDGHWWITLDYRQGSEPAVSWIDVEVGEDIVIASSFGEFLRNLVPLSQYGDA